MNENEDSLIESEVADLFAQSSLWYAEVDVLIDGGAL